MKTKFGKTIAGVALLFCAYGAGGCHGDLDIMQDNNCLLYTSDAADE